jgi:hypothetical protein
MGPMGTGLRRCDKKGQALDTGTSVSSISPIVKPIGGRYTMLDLRRAWRVALDARGEV